jgi:hypothetical protein
MSQQQPYYLRACNRFADDSRVRVNVPEKYAKPAGGKTAKERTDPRGQARVEDGAQRLEDQGEPSGARARVLGESPPLGCSR